MHYVYDTYMIQNTHADTQQQIAHRDGLDSVWMIFENGVLLLVLSTLQICQLMLYILCEHLSLVNTFVEKIEHQ